MGRPDLAVSYEAVAAHWCPVHGSALCPELYMLDRNGQVKPMYHGIWDDDFRCRQAEQLYRQVPVRRA